MKRFWWILLLPLALLPLLVLQPAVLRVGDLSVDNTRFAYYYWSEFFYFKEAYGQYLGDSVDFSQPLDGQMYGDSITWEDHLIGESLSVAADTLAMVLAAEEAGFTLPEEYRTAFLDTWDKFQAQSGGNLKAYLRDSYGRGATEESFREYLLHAHIASAYADRLYNSLNPSMDQVRAYRDDHMGEYLDAGLTDETDQLQQAMEDLLAQLHGEQVRQIRNAYTIRIRHRSIRIRAPKGLYE